MDGGGGSPVVGDGGRGYLPGLAAGVTAGARELAGASMLGLSVRQKAALLDEVSAARRAVEAAYLAVLRALDGEPLEELGATSLPGYVSARTLVPAGRARADVAAARQVDPDTGSLPGIGAALAAGQVCREHVDVAVGVLDRIPAGLRRGAAATIDEFCTDVSRRYRPAQVANLAREILDRLDPDRLHHDEAAFTRRSFTLVADAYGMGLATGQLDPATFAVVKTALDHYAAPTPAQKDTDGTVLFTDQRTPAQRRCDALAEIARRALATAGPAAGGGATRGGEPPRIVIHATPDQVTTTHPHDQHDAGGLTRPGGAGGVPRSSGQAPAGTVDCEATGPLPAGTLRGLLCDCVLEKVLLAPTGAVLDLGRTVRTATPAQRRALHARDHGCTWPGCTIPARWTDVHHAPAWIHGGTTDITALALLCGPHHAQIEHGHYTLTMIDGIPHVTPPPWIDPQQTPVRNTYWTDKRAAATTGQQLALHLLTTPRTTPPRDHATPPPHPHPPPDTS